MTVHKKNIDEIEAVAKISLNVGARSLTYGILYDVGRAKTVSSIQLNYDDLNCISSKVQNINRQVGNQLAISFVDPRYSLHRNLMPNKEPDIVFCPGGTSRLAIRSDGLVFPCQYGFCDDKFATGSITKESIYQIWKSRRWKIFRGIPLQKLSQCSQCHASVDCRLKICRLMAYAASGDIFGVPPGCEWLKWHYSFNNARKEVLTNARKS